MFQVAGGQSDIDGPREEFGAFDESEIHVRMGFPPRRRGGGGWRGLILEIWQHLI